MPPWWQFVNWNHVNRRVALVCWCVVIVLVAVIIALYAAAHSTPVHCLAVADHAAVTVTACMRHGIPIRAR